MWVACIFVVVVDDIGFGWINHCMLLDFGGNAKDALHESHRDVLVISLRPGQYSHEAKQLEPEQHRQAHPQARIPGGHGVGGALGRVGRIDRALRPPRADAGANNLLPFQPCCESTSCSNGSSSATQRWKKRCTTCRPFGTSRACPTGTSRSPASQASCAFAICWSATSWPIRSWRRSMRFCKPRGCN